MSELTSTASATAPAVNPGEPQQQQEPAKPINLHELKEFREVQSKYDQAIARERAEKAALAERIRALETRGLSESERLKYELDEANRRLQEIAESQRIAAEAELRRKDLQSLHRLSKAPLEELEQAKSYDEAVQIALRYADDTSTTAVEKEQAKRDANQAYIPQNNPSTPLSRTEAAIREAINKRDALSYLKEKLSQ